MKKKAGKVLTGMLAATMLWTAAGCGSSVEEAGQNAEMASQDREAAAAETSASGEEEVVKLRFARAGNVQDPETDRILLELQDREKIELEIVSIPWDQFPDKLNIMISTGEQLDLINCDFGSTVEGWANDGLILCWDEYLETGNYPLISSVVNAEMYQDFKINGKVYGKPLPLVPNQRGILIRTDWLEKVGRKMPTNIEELYDVLNAFVYEDPDGNGEDDTEGIWDYFGLPFIERAFAVNAPNMGPNSTEICWVELENGSVTRYEVSEQNREATAFLRKLYQEGLIKEDFITTDVDSDIGFANFASGKYGIADVSDPQAAVDALHTLDPDATVAYLAPLEGENGVIANSGNNGGSFWANFIPSTCNNPEKVLEVLEYCLTEEGRELTEFGIAGVHFTDYEEKDGVRVYHMVKEECQKDWDVENDGWQYPLTWGAFNYGERFYIPIEQYGGDFDEAYANMETWLPEASANGDFADWFAVIAADSKTSPLMNVTNTAVQGDSNTLKSIYDQYRLKIIMDKEVDVDSVFEEMKAEWLAAGGEAVIAAGNEYWKAASGQ